MIIKMVIIIYSLLFVQFTKNIIKNNNNCTQIDSRPWFTVAP